MARVFAFLICSTLVFSYNSSGLAVTNSALAASFAKIRPKECGIMKSPNCRFMRETLKPSAKVSYCYQWPNATCPFEACFHEQKFVGDLKFCTQALTSTISSTAGRIAALFLNIDKGVQPDIAGSLPDTLDGPIGYSECCFAIEKIDFQSYHVSQKSHVADCITNLNHINLFQNPLTNPLFVDFSKAAFRMGSIVFENSQNIQPPINPLRSFRSRIKQISTPLDVPSNKLKTWSKSASRSPQNEFEYGKGQSNETSQPSMASSWNFKTRYQTMDAYWQYYEDCDRWDVKFNAMEKTDRSSNRRLVSQLARLSNSVIQPIRSYLNSFDFDWLYRPIRNAWQTAEFWVVETNFVFSIKPDWDVLTAKEKQRAQIK